MNFSVFAWASPVTVLGADVSHHRSMSTVIQQLGDVSLPLADSLDLDRYRFDRIFNARKSLIR